MPSRDASASSMSLIGWLSWASPAESVNMGAEEKPYVVEVLAVCEGILAALGRVLLRGPWLCV